MLQKHSVQIPIYTETLFFYQVLLDFFKGGGNQNVSKLDTKYNYLSE